MGKLLFRWRCPFRVGVGIYANSIPYFPANTQFYAGFQVTLRGVNLDLLDDGTILLYDYSRLNTDNEYYYMRLVSKSLVSATFELAVDVNYTHANVWNLLAAPFNPPRTFVEYVTL